MIVHLSAEAEYDLEITYLGGTGRLQNVIADKSVEADFHGRRSASLPL